MSTTHTKPCGDCKGNGYKPYDRGAYACETCNTSGRVPDAEGQLRAELDSVRTQLRGVTAKLIESEDRRVRARQEADAALKRERQNGDILLKVAGAFNGWANGKRGASGASEALEQIGEALGVPFAEEAAR